jgi:hypothetical protein
VGEVEIFFEPPRANALARYDWVLDDLYLPETLRQPGTDRVRADLTVEELGTVLHELAHAELDVLVGVEGQVHRQLTAAIEHDLAEDPAHRILGTTRYVGLKADEVSGYFIGHSLVEVLRAIGDVAMYNLEFPELAGRRDDRLVLPRPDCPMPSLARLARRRFGLVSVRHLARFRGDLIGWKEEGRTWVKQQLYLDALGLSAPADAAELVARLNALETPWGRNLRARVMAVRRALGPAGPFGVD